MRVLHLISGLGGGGAENLLVDVAAEMRARGISQRVLYYTPLDTLVPRFAAMGVETELIDHEAIGYLRSVCDTRARIRAFAPDVLHTHLMRADLIGRAAALLTRGLPCFTTLHNMDAWREERTPFALAMAAFDRATVNHVRRVRLIAVAECCRRYAIEHTRLRPDKIDTLPNFAAPRPEKWGPGVTRAQLGLDAGDLVLVSVGRLQPQKRQMDLIDCAAWLRGRGVTDVKFVIVGDGDLRPELEAAIRARGVAEQVLLTGFVQNVYDYYAIADAFVLPSAFEGAPIVLLEASHHGLPAVVSDIPATREMIQAGAGAVSYPVGDVAALGDLVLAVRAGRVDLGALARKGRDFERGLTPQRYVDGLLGLYGKGGVRGVGRDGRNRHG